MPLYFNSNQKFKTRKALLSHFIRYRNTTYNDIECKDLQCENSKNRSITDLLEITKSVFPRTSIEAVLRIITELIDDGVSIGLVWCTQIHKVVVRNDPQQTVNYMTEYSRRNYYNNTGVDGYSLKTIDEIITNIKK